MSYAQLTIVGRLGRDAEVRVTQKGEQMVTASVAVGTGDKSQWYKITAMGKTGEGLAKAVKGDMIFVQGGLTLKTYERKDGKASIDATVWANVIRTLGAKKEDEGFTSSAPRQSEVADLDFDPSIPF